MTRLQMTQGVFRGTTRAAVLLTAVHFALLKQQIWNTRRKEMFRMEYKTVAEAKDLAGLRSSAIQEK